MCLRFGIAPKVGAYILRTVSIECPSKGAHAGDENDCSFLMDLVGHVASLDFYSRNTSHLSGKVFWEGIEAEAAS